MPIMRALQPEPPATKPADFDPWLEELGLFADCEGEQAVLGVVLRFAPVECLRYLGAQPGLFAGLLARARYADRARFLEGLLRGRRVEL